MPQLQLHFRGNALFLKAWTCPQTHRARQAEPPESQLWKLLTQGALCRMAQLAGAGLGSLRILVMLDVFLPMFLPYSKYQWVSSLSHS